MGKVRGGSLTTIYYQGFVMSTKMSKITVPSPSFCEGIHQSRKGLQNVLLTVKETSEILKTNVDYVYKLKDSGLLKFIKIGQYKILYSTLLEFLEEYQGKDITNPFEVKELLNVESQCQGQE